MFFGCLRCARGHGEVEKLQLSSWHLTLTTNFHVFNGKGSMFYNPLAQVKILASPGCSQLYICSPLSLALVLLSFGFELPLLLLVRPFVLDDFSCLVGLGNAVLAQEAVS